ncbi:hypothetical protein NC651_040417 [Populus alba x Populus x berolinensis]|nr:hypothetical protein NC651_040417 [Populus alba x Populus x berolinensis]
METKISSKVVSVLFHVCYLPSYPLRSFPITRW